jgi:hypothetical protein
VSNQADQAKRDAIAETIVSDIAIVTEAAFRRGFHQGYEAGARGDRLAFELLAWRFGTPPDVSPEQLQSGRTIRAVERLRLQAEWLIEKLRGVIGAGTSWE